MQYEITLAELITRYYACILVAKTQLLETIERIHLEKVIDPSILNLFRIG
jgi:hypothetical protein